MGTEQDILVCARDIYVRDGLTGLSMRAVARCAGVSATAIYRHFENKEALLVEVALQGFAIFKQYLMRGLGGGTPHERLLRTGQGYFDFAMEHRSDYTVMFMSPREHFDFEYLKSRTSGEADSTFLFLVDRVRECMDAGVLARADPEQVAVTIWAMCHGVCSLYFNDDPARFGEVEGVRSLYDASLGALLAGLKDPA